MLNKKYKVFYMRGFPCLPSMDLLQMILESGVNINGTDHLGNTPLHVAATPFLASPVHCIPSHSDYFQELNPLYLSEKIIDLFLDKGAYIFARNEARETPFDEMIKSAYDRYFSHIPHLIPMFESYTEGLPTLLRLTAQCVKELNIPLKNRLPSALEQFVRLH